MYRPLTQAQLSAAATEYSAALAARKAGDVAAATAIATFERWCLEQPNGGAPFNDHSWADWRRCTDCDGIGNAQIPPSEPHVYWRRCQSCNGTGNRQLFTMPE